MSGAPRGPIQLLLQTSTGQWVMLGMGAYTMFPEQVKAVLNPLVLRAVQNAPPQIAKQIAPALENAVGKSVMVPHTPPPAPIIIHTPGSNARGSWTATIITYAVGTGACWAGYVVLTNTLPEAAKELLPVTRKIFDTAAKTLGQAILDVKESLENQIWGIVESQEDLDRKLQENTDTVNDIQSELGEARNDLGALGISLDRCETSLLSSQNMHAYTTRGVKLLVRCVANLLPNQDGFLTELSQFIKEGDEYPQSNNNNAAVQQLPPPATPQQHTINGRYIKSDGTPRSRASTGARIDSVNEIHNMLNIESPAPTARRSSSYTPSTSPYYRPNEVNA